MKTYLEKKLIIFKRVYNYHILFSDIFKKYFAYAVY